MCIPFVSFQTVDLVDSMTPLVKNAPATASFAVALNSQQRQQPPRSATLSPATLATPVVAPSPVSGTFLQQQQQQQSRSATATLATPVMAPSPVSGMFLHYDATASLKAPRNTARFSPIPQTPPMCPTPILPCTSQSSFVEVSGPTGRDIGFLAEEPSSPLSGFQHLQVLPEASPAPTSPSTTSTSSSKRKRSPSVQADDARPHKKKATNPLLRRATTNSFYGVSHSPNPSGAPLAPAHSTGASQPSSPLLDASVIYTKGASSSAFDVQDAAFSFSFRA
ncbi:hypothetical protein DXG03_007526 [Asterophora parasitica]|uniref:Uncharacterized protein n=1 Tax=Asterophora parasitica TaxID=117018 RepID=A0A9P7G8V6_9AGAR|nr:hypothetical protein DXG03_007526 [Asterophora parasitica]